MKLKKITPYLIVFIASFVLTPVVITSFIKIANNQAYAYVKSFRPNTQQLPDGKYQGKFKAFGFITMANVKFTLKNGNIQSVQFKKMYHSPGSPYKENIVNQIKKVKRLEVDAITGATRTSNFAKAAIKSAIENKNAK